MKPPQLETLVHLCYSRKQQNKKGESVNKIVCFPRMSIPYRRPYRFGHRYDIFRIPVNTGVPFRVYRYFIYMYIYIYIYVCMYVCMYVSVYIYIIINIKVYHKTFPQFRINYSWFQTLVSIKREKKNRKLKSYHCILKKQIILIS